MKNSVYSKLLNLELFCKYFILVVKILKFEERTRRSHRPKLVHADNVAQNLCNKVKKSSKTELEQKTLTAFSV